MVTNPSPPEPPSPAPAVPPPPGRVAADGHKASRRSNKPSCRFLFFNAVPSWLVSLILHTILLIVMAVFTIRMQTEEPPLTLELCAQVDTGESEPFEEIPESIEIETSEEMPIEELSAELPVPEKVLDAASSLDMDLSPRIVEPEPLGRLTTGRNDLLSDIPDRVGKGTGDEDGTQEGDTGDDDARRAVWNGRKNRGGAGSTPESEQAVDAALRWLAAHQRSDGSWDFDHRFGPCNGRCDNPGMKDMASLGATGMALLPFLGAGQTHRQGDYQETIRLGLKYLVDHMRVQESMGALYDVGGNMYSHGICTIVLTEAYGMTGERDLRIPAQRAVNFIVYAQDPNGGGWRYEPRDPGDMSVVGWQLMALRSAQMAYLDVPPEVFTGANKFLDSTQIESGARYGYMGPGSGDATTAIGLLCRMYGGWPRDYGALQRGVAFLDAQGPDTSNMYYNYYATQVMRHYGGQEWERWNPKIRDWLVRIQEKNGHAAGSWFVPDDIGSGSGGRLYVTSMAAMTLEVYYRYLPLYREQAIDQNAGAQ